MLPNSCPMNVLVFKSLTKMELFVRILVVFYIISVPYVESVPVDAPEAAQTEVILSNLKTDENSTTTEVTSPASEIEGAVVQKPTEAEEATVDSGAEKKDEKEPFVGTVGAVSVPDNVGSASNVDPSLYGTLLTPDNYQHYVNQFGGAAYLPYAAPAYPSPVGYPHPPPAPIYPSPYVVQTGYEGFLVPATTTTTTTTTTGSTTSDAGTTESSNSLISQLNPLNLLTNIFPVLMMSTIFKVFAAVVTTIGMIFFGNAIGSVICNYTPICDMTFRAAAFLRSNNGAEHVGRMIAEEITPERVRRATDFVRTAIRKYRQLQKFVNDDEK